jgi:hypothetical protein
MIDMDEATKCECGADAAGYPFHSDYCPKYGGDEK